MYYEIDYKLGENLHNNTYDISKNKNSDQNMAPDSENVTEENFIQDSRNGVQKYSTEDYFDVCKDVHENSSTGLLSCVSSTGDPTYDTAIANMSFFAQKMYCFRFISDFFLLFLSIIFIFFGTF